MTRTTLVAALALVASCGGTARTTPATRPGPTPVATVPFEDSFNLIFLQVAVGNAAPRWFLLDSGADITLLDRDAAKELGVAIADAGTSAQPGGEIDIAHAHDVAFHVGAAEFVSKDVWITALHPLNAFVGRRFDGILGYDFLTRFTVAVHYDDRQVAMFEPASFDYRGPGDSIPVELLNNEAFIHARLDTGAKQVDARLKLDTGSVDVLGLNGSFVQAQTLFAADQPRIERAGVGIGGATEGYITRLPTLTIGHQVMHDMVIDYGADTKRGGDAGTVGAAVLHRFTAIFDYARNRLILEPGTHAADPFAPDLSGLFAGTDDTFEHVVVLSVSPGTPAAEAGIAAGDVITHVDGKPFASLGLPRMFDRVHIPGPMRLHVVRDGAERDVVLTLRSLLP